MMASAAKHHSIPVVVCTGLYKLSPLYPYDEDSFNVSMNPDSILGFEEGDLIEKVTVTNPYYDYVSPTLVDLFLTNQGGHPPSYLYRLMYCFAMNTVTDWDKMNAEFPRGLLTICLLYVCYCLASKTMTPMIRLLISQPWQKPFQRSRELRLKSCNNIVTWCPKFHCQTYPCIRGVRHSLQGPFLTGANFVVKPAMQTVWS